MLVLSIRFNRVWENTIEARTRPFWEKAKVVRVKWFPEPIFLADYWRALFHFLFKVRPSLSGGNLKVFPLVELKKSQAFIKISMRAAVLFKLFFMSYLSAWAKDFILDNVYMELKLIQGTYQPFVFVASTIPFKVPKRSSFLRLCIGYFVYYGLWRFSMQKIPSRDNISTVYPCGIKITWPNISRF